MLAGAWSRFTPAVSLDGFPPPFTTVITCTPPVSECLHGSSPCCPTPLGCRCCRHSHLQLPTDALGGNVAVPALRSHPATLSTSQGFFKGLFFLFSTPGCLSYSQYLGATKRSPDVCCKPSYICLRGMRYLIGSKDALY